MSALAALLLLCLLLWVSGSQGNHQKQKPWDLNTWKIFSCMLRKTWQPSSFLQHCCQVHAGCQTYTLLKQDYRSKSLPTTTLQAISSPAVMLDHHPQASHRGSLPLFTLHQWCFKNLTEVPFSCSYPANKPSGALRAARTTSARPSFILISEHGSRKSLL